MQLVRLRFYARVSLANYTRRVTDRSINDSSERLGGRLFLNHNAITTYSVLHINI